MEVLKEIHDFITRPMYIDDSTIGYILTIIAHIGIIGWIIIGCNISIGWIVSIGWIILVGCYLNAVLCGLIWYYIDSKHIIAHYVYFFLMLTLSGCGIFAIPLLLAFGILTIPLWIGKVITFWKLLIPIGITLLFGMFCIML